MVNQINEMHNSPCVVKTLNLLRQVKIKHIIQNIAVQE